MKANRKTSKKIVQSIANFLLFRYNIFWNDISCL